ncbi:MAG: hypothetical protein V1753_00850 [Pseudomonadota bacterium]
MQIYFLDNDSYPLTPALEKGLAQMGYHIEHLSLPSSHEDIGKLMHARHGGIVFIPAVWQDLACVKIVQEIGRLSEPFETVICGREPAASNLLVVAFNEGLCAYLVMPFDDDALKQTIARAKSRYAEKCEHIRKEQLIEKLESQRESLPSHIKHIIYDQLLARALQDALAQRGPFVENRVKVLLVMSSQAQRTRLEAFLKKANIEVTGARTMQEAKGAAEQTKFSAIVSDSVLPDGDAITLATLLLQSLRSEVPRFLVWTSSPDRAKELLAPESHIDDVIPKPDADAGMDSILLSIVVGLYQAKE